MSAKTTGADGSGRSYTVEQKAAVIRVLKCGPNQFYEILQIESQRTTCSEGDIKKAYRKLSLLTHPDKNGYEGADEAFKRMLHALSLIILPTYLK
jgi:DnaJ family protein B protein 12